MNALSQFTRTTFFKFATYVKREMYMINQNLKFQDDNYDMQLYFFLPAPIKQKEKIYKINEKSNSLSLSFTLKQKLENEIPQSKSKPVNFSLQYQELSYLLNIQQKQDKIVAIQRTKLQDLKQYYQWLTIRYDKSSHQLNLKIKKLIQNKTQNIESIPDLIDFKLEYSNYKMIQLLIQNSLFELSGLGMIFQMKRIQDLQMINRSTQRNSNNFDKQIKEFYQ